MRLVLDTNTIIRAATGHGAVREILDLWLEGKFQILISTSILLEYEEVLHRPKFKFPNWAIVNFLHPFLNHAIQISPRKTYNLVLDDPEDNKFLDCAIEGKADFIITNDSHLLKLKSIEDIRIITPNKFLKLLK